MEGRIEYRGVSCLRHRLCLAVLSSRPLLITEIRSGGDTHLGLNEAEVAFISLIVSLSNGAKTKISETGTQLTFVPGLLHGGRAEVDCVGKPISYFLEPLLLLGPFAKKPFNITLRGNVCPGDGQVSVQAISAACLPVLEKFGVEPVISIVRGGSKGEVNFTCTVRKQIIFSSSNFTSPGLVKKVRGNGVGFKVARQLVERATRSAKGALIPLLSDVDMQIGMFGGEAGYGLLLRAETTTGTVYVADGWAVAGESPEDFGANLARKLLREISAQGTVDSIAQPLFLSLMALGRRDVVSGVIGPLTPMTVQLLRDLKQFFGLTFRVEGDGPFTLSCLAIGYTNLNKTTL